MTGNPHIPLFNVKYKGVELSVVSTIFLGSVYYGAEWPEGFTEWIRRDAQNRWECLTELSKQEARELGNLIDRMICQ